MDVPGTHLVIKGELHKVGFPDCLKDLSGVAIGEHLRGKRAEKPHYHCWLPDESLKSAIRDWYNDRLPDLDWKKNGNAYWAWKPHDSFRRWVEYVFHTKAECKEPRVVIWNILGVPEPVPRLIENLIIPTQDVEGGRAHDGVPVPVCVVAPSAPQKNKSKREPAHIRFHAYCSEIWDGPNDTPELDDIMDAWIDWTQGAYELRNVSAPIRYTWYMLNKKDPKMKRTMKEEMRRKLFSEY